MRISLIASYVALSPIYWLPGIPQATLTQVKIVLVAVLLVTGIRSFQFADRRTSMIVASLAISALCSYLSLGIHDANLLPPLARSIDFIEPLCWILIISSVPEHDSERLIRALSIALSVFFFVSLYPLAARLGLVPDVAVPEDSVELLGERFSYLTGVLSVSTAGFNSGHTGWGPAVAFGCVTLASIIIHTRDRALGEQKTAMAVLLMGTICVAAAGARAATLALVVVCAIWFLSSNRSRAALALFAVVAVLLSLVVDFSALVPERLMRMTAAGDLFSMLDDLSTGRMTTYVDGMLDFMSAPFIGVGTDGARVALRNGLEIVSIHNVWLRLAAEGGVVMLAPALWTIWLIMSAVSRASARRKANGLANLPDVRPVIGLGLLLSLFEPSVIFGSFNNNVLFWTAVAIAVRGASANAALGNIGTEQQPLALETVHNVRRGI